MSPSSSTFEIGDAVRVKDGVRDADFPSTDIGGWQGRIVEVLDGEPTTLVVEWDSATLQEMPDASIDAAEEEGLEWERYALSPDDVKEAAPRDAPQDVKREQDRIREKHFRTRIGEEETYIHQILDKAPSLGERTIFQTWEGELQRSLSFPIKATVDASQAGAPPHSGDEVLILDVYFLDCHYGLLATVRAGPEVAQIPLIDLDPMEQSLEYRPLRAYQSWFANR